MNLISNMNHCDFRHWFHSPLPHSRHPPRKARIILITLLIGFLSGATATAYVLLRYGYLTGFQRFSQTGARVRARRRGGFRRPPSQPQQNASAENQTPETMPQTETQTQMSSAVATLLFLAIWVGTCLKSRSAFLHDESCSDPGDTTSSVISTRKSLFPRCYVLLKWILIKLMKKEDDVKKGNSAGYSLGDLIVALYQEAGRVCSQPAEQKVMVYSALKHLLRTRVSSKHRIALQA